MRQKVRKEWVTKKFHSGCRDTREWITSLWLIRSNRSNLWASQAKKLTTWGCVRHISQSEHENDKSCQGDVYFERTNSLNQLVCKSQYLPRRVASSVLSEWQDFECLALLLRLIMLHKVFWYFWQRKKCQTQRQNPKGGIRWCFNSRKALKVGNPTLTHL